MIGNAQSFCFRVLIVQRFQYLVQYLVQYFLHENCEKIRQDLDSVLETLANEAFVELCGTEY